MQTFLEHVLLAAPLFLLVFFGYGLARWFAWARTIGDGLSRFVFNIALPAMLFYMMSDLSRLPPVDARLLIAFFGSCALVFLFGRLVAARVFRLDGVSGSIFALGGIFSNNALLGLPLAKMLLGDAALPSVALVLVFNSLILWSLVTISVEWARHGELSPKGFLNTLGKVLTNPIVAAILLGTLWGLSGAQLPTIIKTPLYLLGQAAGPLALVALGMGLVEYGVRASWQLSSTICGIKLLLQPFVVWFLARLLGLPLLETQAVVLLASMSVGANVYLMSKQFKALEGPVAASLVLSTALAAITTPLVLTLAAHFSH